VVAAAGKFTPEVAGRGRKGKRSVNVAARMGRGKPALSQPRGLRLAIEPDH
jgi:hypothetical protein